MHRDAVHPNGDTIPHRPFPAAHRKLGRSRTPGLESIPQPIMLLRHSDLLEPLSLGKSNFELLEIRSATDLGALVSACPRSEIGA